MKKPRQGPIPNEADHLARARAGDKEAYRFLVEGYQDRLFGLVVSMTGDAAQAEDLSQEIFVKAYFALPRFEGGSAFYTWLFRIASNHCLDHLRRRPRKDVSLDAPVGENTSELTALQQLSAPENELPEANLQFPSETAELLKELTPDHRLILTLRELEDYSYEELTAALKCNMNTVKSRLGRARDALKAAFTRKYGNIWAREDVQTNRGNP
jgi:RNA polymerase sigma-70 factor, ECF subfamily